MNVPDRTVAGGIGAFVRDTCVVGASAIGGLDGSGTTLEGVGGENAGGALSEPGAAFPDEAGGGVEPALDPVAG